jgi:hypothetical protein
MNGTSILRIYEYRVGLSCLNGRRDHLSSAHRVSFAQGGILSYQCRGLLSHSRLIQRIQLLLIRLYHNKQPRPKFNMSSMYSDTSYPMDSITPL